MKLDNSINHISEDDFEDNEKSKRKKKDNIAISPKKYEPNENDKKAEKIIDLILSNNNIQLNELINFPISQRYPFDGNLFSYLIQKINRTEKDNYFLVYYLKFYDTFNNTLKKIYNDKEKLFLFNQIINKIKIEEKSQNDILFKIGDNAEKFYFLLKGSVMRLNTIKYESIMNKFEFFLYMKYLYKIGEIRLFNLILKENEEIFDKYEVLYFILEDKNMKFSGDSLKQLKRMEATYVSERIEANKMLDMNHNNTNKIVISETPKFLDDILKGDYVVPLFEGHIKKINIPIKDYLKNLKPINFNEDNDELIKKRVILYTYDIDKEIKVGENLEELDLKLMQKRSSTVICNNHCIFGFFYKKEYISCLKITQTKFHKSEISFLLGNELFSTLNFREFDKNYYHLYEFEKKSQKNMLFEQGEKNDNIFFLKNGEINVNFEGSFDDLYRIIGLKGGPKNRKMLDINYIKRFHSINIDENIFKEKQLFNLFKIKENFPIGFEDFIDEENDNKILFNAFCVMDSEVLSISRQKFNQILYKENEVRKTKHNYVMKRKKLLIDELNVLKNGLIQKYIKSKFNINIDLPYLFDESPLLSKPKIKQKNFLIKPNLRKNNLLKIDTKINNNLIKEMKFILNEIRNKDNLNSQKYDFLYSENNQLSNERINNSKKEEHFNSITSTFRRGANSFKIMNIKDLSKKNKINNNQNSKVILNSRKKNEQNLDPYDKIYNTLKNEDKNKNDDFSYLNMLYPPHPNKHISKSKKNIFKNKIHKMNSFDKSTKLTKLDKTNNNMSNSEKMHKNLISSFNIINNKKKFNDGTKLKFGNFHLKEIFNINYRLSKIWEKKKILDDNDQHNNRDINKNDLRLPKI